MRLITYITTLILIFTTIGCNDNLKEEPIKSEILGTYYLYTKEPLENIGYQDLDFSITIENDKIHMNNTPNCFIPDGQMNDYHPLHYKNITGTWKIKQNKTGYYILSEYENLEKSKPNHSVGYLISIKMKNDTPMSLELNFFDTDPRYIKLRKK